MMAGCTFDPQPPKIEFRKVLVGETARGTAYYRNNHNSKNADVVGYTVNEPFSVSGSPESVPSLDNGSVLTLTFAPKTAGQFEDEVRPGLANPMDVQAKPLKLKGE